MCDMTSVNIAKILEYLKIKESLRSEDLTEYYLCEGIFLYIFVYFYIFFLYFIQARSKTNYDISLNLMIICSKDISEKCFSFNLNVYASLKFYWALRGLLEDSQALGHSESTRALGGYSKGTWALEALRYLST